MPLPGSPVGAGFFDNPWCKGGGKSYFHLSQLQMINALERTVTLCIPTVAFNLDSTFMWIQTFPFQPLLKHPFHDFKVVPTIMVDSTMKHYIGCNLYNYSIYILEQCLCSFSHALQSNITWGQFH